MAADDQDLPDGVSIGGDDSDGESVTEKLVNTFNQYYDDVVDADNAGEAMNLALDAGSDFASLVVAAEDTDRAYSLAKTHLNQISDARSALGRKDIRAHWEDEIEVKEREATVEDGVPSQFEELVGECLVGVTKTVLTDKKKDETEYELDFNDGVGTSLVLGHSTLMSHEACWKAYTSASGQYPVRRTDSDFTDGDWQNHIGEIIEDIETVETEVGPRTGAWRSLKNIVNRSVAYTSMRDAVSRGGIWVGDVQYTVGTGDGDGETRTVRELRIMREDVAQVTSQHDVTDRGLQIELKARGLASPRISGISKSTYVNGSYQTFWCFDLDAEGMPELDDEDIVEEVDDAMSRLDDDSGEGDDDDEDGGDGEGSTAGSDDGDDPGAGDESGDGEESTDDPDSDDDDRMPAGGPGKVGEFGVAPGGDGE